MVSDTFYGLITVFSIIKKRWLLIFVLCALVVFWQIGTMRLYIALSLAKHESIVVSVIADQSERRLSGGLYDDFRLIGSQKDVILSKMWTDTDGFGLLLRAEIPFFRVLRGI